MGRELFVDDEYVTEGNRHYKISSIDKVNRIATATLLGDIQLPEIEEVGDVKETARNLGIVPVADLGDDANVLIYCTHSDESYVPTDGTTSIKGGEEF